MTTTYQVKATISYIHAGVWSIFDNDQITIYFEDNNLEDCFINRLDLRDNFKYYCLLHHLFNISTSVPLYIDPFNPTPYIPPTPPRQLTNPFPNLYSHLWPQITNNLQNCFVYAPHNQERIITQPTKFQNICSEFEDSKKNHTTYKLLNDVWISKGGILYPYSLSIHANLLASYSPQTIITQELLNYRMKYERDLFII